jgi:IPT/TIG domain
MLFTRTQHTHSTALNMNSIKSLLFLAIIGTFVLAITTISCQKVDSPAPVITPIDTTHPGPPKITITHISPTVVFTGDTVIITGTNFTSPATISINGGPAIVGTVSADSTTIIFIAPAPTSGTLIGTSNGQTVTYNNFVVLAKPSVTFTSDSVAPGNLIAQWTFDEDSKEKMS